MWYGMWYLICTFSLFLITLPLLISCSYERNCESNLMLPIVGYSSDRRNCESNAIFHIPGCPNDERNCRSYVIFPIPGCSNNERNCDSNVTLSIPGFPISEHTWTHYLREAQNPKECTWLWLFYRSCIQLCE